MRGALRVRGRRAGGDPGSRHGPFYSGTLGGSSAVAQPRGDRYTGRAPEAAIRQDPPLTPPAAAHLGVWHLRLAAASHPLLFRRDRPRGGAEPALGVADVVRYVALARRRLKGALALEIEGPGDPLASPETVLRALSLLHDHHPDVLTGLVVDGPLMAEYADDLADFGLGYVVLRMDATTFGTARRLVDGAFYRGDLLPRDEAAQLWLESGPQALRLAASQRIPTAVRFTLVPSVNADEIAAVAARAHAEGARRVEVVAHRPQAGTPLARAGSPTAHEMEDARAAADDVFADGPRETGAPTMLDWLQPERLQSVDLDRLDAEDVLSTLPQPDEDMRGAPVLPPRRAQIVAVATRDGTLVDTPLANATLLRVYAITAERIRLLGSRPLSLDPRRRHDGVGHAPSFLRAVIGCRAVVATQVTGRAATLLNAVGILPVALGGPVEEVLDRVARGTVRHAGTTS